MFLMKRQIQRLLSCFLQCVLFKLGNKKILPGLADWVAYWALPLTPFGASLFGPKLIIYLISNSFWSFPFFDFLIPTAKIRVEK